MASLLLRRALGSRSNQILSSFPCFSSPSSATSRVFSSTSTLIQATLFPGDGIGPVIAESVKQILGAYGLTKMLDVELQSIGCPKSPISKDVEIAISCRKGRTGTAAGDVAFPKGNENLASVLKRYRRRLSNKPVGITPEGPGSRKVPTSSPYGS